jgi:hypothetical protein
LSAQLAHFVLAYFSIGAKGAVAGAFNSFPLISKCEPWHGQSQQRSKELK